MRRITDGVAPEHGWSVHLNADGATHLLLQQKRILPVSQRFTGVVDAVGQRRVPELVEMRIIDLRVAEL